MTARIFDFSEIDLTGELRYEGEAIASAHYNGERLWPFGPDLLYLGGVIGATYLPDAGVVYGATGLASFGDGLAAVLDQKSGVPVLGPELVANGAFGSDTVWTKGAGWAISGGQASITSAASNSDLSQNIGAVSGRFYRVPLRNLEQVGPISTRGTGRPSMSSWRQPLRHSFMLA